MGTRSRILANAAVLVAVAGVTMPAYGESMDSDSVIPARQEGWTWRGTELGIDAATASGVGPDQLPVAATPQGEDKASYLLFDSIPTGPGDITLSMAVDREAQNLLPEGAVVRACLVVSPWKAGAPIAWSERPESDCSHATPGEFDAESDAFIFDLEPLRSQWIGQNHGVALQPGADTVTAFQIVFKGSSVGGARLTFASEDLASAPAPADAPSQPTAGGMAPEFVVPTVAPPPVLSVTPPPAPTLTRPPAIAPTRTSARRPAGTVSFAGLFAGMLFFAAGMLIVRVFGSLRTSVADDLRGPYGNDRSARRSDGW